MGTFDCSYTGTNILQTFHFNRWLENNILCLFGSTNVQTFQQIKLIYSRGNFLFDLSEFNALIYHLLSYSLDPWKLL